MEESHARHPLVLSNGLPSDFFLTLLQYAPPNQTPISNSLLLLILNQFQQGFFICTLPFSFLSTFTFTF
jgi:hypothetical protein